MEKSKIKRRNGYIWLEKGLTAVEGMSGNLPSLSIRRDGREIQYYKGSSLYFSRNLTDEDKDYLASLAS